MFDILFDPDKIQGAFNLLLQVEGMILGVVGMVRGSDAVKRYQESKARDALHSALENAVDLSRTLSKTRDVATGALADVAESLLPDQVDKALDYVENAVPESIRKLIGPVRAPGTVRQLEKMLQAKTKAKAAKDKG